MEGTGRRGAILSREDSTEAGACLLRRCISSPGIMHAGTVCVPCINPKRNGHFSFAAKLRSPTCHDGQAGAHAHHGPHPDLHAAAAVGPGAGRRAGAGHVGLARRGAGRRAGRWAGWHVKALGKTGAVGWVHGLAHAKKTAQLAKPSAFSFRPQHSKPFSAVQQRLAAGLTVAAMSTRVSAGMPAERTTLCRLAWVATSGTFAALEMGKAGAGVHHGEARWCNYSKCMQHASTGSALGWATGRTHLPSARSAAVRPTVVPTSARGACKWDHDATGSWHHDLLVMHFAMPPWQQPVFLQQGRAKGCCSGAWWPSAGKAPPTCRLLAVASLAVTVSLSRPPLRR